MNPRSAAAWHAIASLPGQAGHGRPARITARAAIAAALGVAAAALIPGTPAAPADIAAAALWCILTSQAELATSPPS
jgi:hypothetical protein